MDHIKRGALATSGPGEQEEARLLSNGSVFSSVPSDDPQLSDKPVLAPTVAPFSEIGPIRI